MSPLYYIYIYTDSDEAINWCNGQSHTNDHTHNRFTDAVYNYINNVNRWSKCSVSYMVCYIKSEMKSLVTLVARLAISEYVICNVFTHLQNVINNLDQM